MLSLIHPSIGSRVVPANRAWAWLMLMVWSLLAAAPALADTGLVELPAVGTVAEVKQQALVRLDPEGELNAAELMIDGEGFAPFDGRLNLESPAAWLRLEVQAPDDASSPYVIRVSRRFFTRFDLYLETADGGLSRRSATVNRLIDARTVGREFIFDLPLAPGETRTLLIHVETFQGSLQPLELWIQDESSFAESQANTYLVFGLIFGVLLALIFHNFVLYLNLRQPGHLYYVLAMTSMLLLLGVDSGMLQNYLLPEFLLASVGRLNVLLASLMVTTIFIFFRVFTGARRHAPRLIQVTTGLVVLLAVLSVSQLFADQPLFSYLAIATQLLNMTIFALLLLGAWLAGRQGSVEGYIFLLAWGIYILSALARTMLSLDIASRNLFLEYLMYFAAVTEASILALGLAYRVRVLYERHATALREQNKAAMLANLDPLTGAYNRRFLETYLGNILAEHEQGRLERSVLILDLDDFKEANDTFGHAAGDLVLRQLVRRCRRVLDEDEVICRLGGDEFVIIMREHGQHTGVKVAEEIIQAFTEEHFRFENQSIKVTASIGVVSCVSASLSVSDVLRMADQALYQAKQAGRNRAVQFDPDLATPFRHGHSVALPEK